MGYMHIDNLYKRQEILMFKECYAMEKIHGTSAHLTFKWGTIPNSDPRKEGWAIQFFSGGTSYNTFVALFDQTKLLEAFIQLAIPTDRELTVYGESYGGKEQGMSHTYGTIPKFIAFDVQIGDSWLNVPVAEKIVQSLGLEFVHYVKVSTDLKELDAQRDAPSMQAIRNGISKWVGDQTGPFGIAGIHPVENPKPREGVVLRPLIELTMNNGHRVIAKHKGEKFQETATPRPVVDPEKMKVLAEAEAIANEWVTKNRLIHVLDKIPEHGMEKMREILNAMVEDVLREGAGELVDSPAVRKALCTKTATMYKAYLQEKLALDNQPSPV